MIKFRHKGNFSKTIQYITKVEKKVSNADLDRFGQLGVEALRSATPIGTGETADSWGFDIKRKLGSVAIIWTNSNIVNGVPIAVILQYGHATNNGGYVQGNDYINPAIKPVFNQIVNDLWKEVTNL